MDGWDLGYMTDLSMDYDSLGPKGIRDNLSDIVVLVMFPALPPASWVLGFMVAP